VGDQHQKPSLKDDIEERSYRRKKQEAAQLSSLDQSVESPVIMIA
jgi:hypothetical protein